MSPEVLAALADRMNRIAQVRWDRCVMRSASGVSYGWIDRDDGRSDFVLLDFSWGETSGLAGETVPWLSVGYSTSSAEFSEAIGTALGLGGDHKDCERIEGVFGESVARRC